MGQYGFDELMDEQSEQQRDRRPFWAVQDSDEKDLLKWLHGEVSYLEEESRTRIDQARKGMANYKGIQYEMQTARTNSRRDVSDENKTKIDKIVVNHLFDLTESHVSRAVKYKPGIDVSPANPEDFGDTINAKVKKACLDHIWYKTGFREILFPLNVRDSKITGEDWLFIEWNPDLGGEHRASKRAKAQGKETVTISDGSSVSLDKPVRVGDVDYSRVPCVDVFLEKVRAFEKANYLFRKETLNVDELKSEYPKLAEKISPETEGQIYDYEQLQTRKLYNEVTVYTFYHKKTDKVSSGKKIRFIKNLLLENDDLPYDHGKIPAVRLTDIDLPNEPHGVSSFQNIRPLTNIYNNLTNMINRNQILVSHPKWVMPAGACKLEQLGNDITIVQYKGPTPPQLVQMNATPVEVFNFRQQIKEEFQQLSGVHGVSRGEPPPGVKAGVALQFLNEQENERSNNFMLKVNKFLQEVADMTIRTAAQYYKESDERMIGVLGKNNAWMVKRLDTKSMQGDFDVRVMNSSALPESKAMRVQMIMDLSERFPDLFSPDQVIELLDLGQSEKMVDIATMAVRAAEAENEDMLEGSQVLSPAEYEDHLAHWSVHARLFQNPSFKRLPAEIQKKAIDHQRATEMMMYELAKKNPLFMQKAMGLKNFPMFYVDEIYAMEGGGTPSLSPINPPPSVAQPSPMTATAQSPNNPEAPGAEPNLPINPS